MLQESRGKPGQMDPALQMSFGALSKRPFLLLRVLDLWQASMTLILSWTLAEVSFPVSGMYGNSTAMYGNALDWPGKFPLVARMLNKIF